MVLLQATLSHFVIFYFSFPFPVYFSVEMKVNSPSNQNREYIGARSHCKPEARA